jgi:hypothetical protein
VSISIDSVSVPAVLVQIESQGHAQTSRLRSAYVILAVAAGLQPAAAEGTAARLEKAVAVLNKLTDSSGYGIRPEEIASADCVAVIPGFYKGAAVVGVVFEADLLLEVSFGRGFIACRNGDNWSAPAFGRLGKRKVLPR